jgi:4-amino-4-deoxy-L-arabinose transferase-like glycosyltransferase
MTVACPPSKDRSFRAEAAAPLSAALSEPAKRWLPPRLALVLAIGLTLRLTVAAWLWLYAPRLDVWDESDYDTLAINLAQHADFAYEPGQPTSLRPPLYPAIVAAVYLVAGEHNYTAVRVLQAAVGTLTAWIVFALARGLYDERTGIVAAAICVCYPSLVAATGVILTETLFTFFLCAACLLLQQCLSRDRLWRFAALGAVLALGALTRSILWLFPPVLLLFLLAFDPNRYFGRRLLHATIAVVAFAVVIAPWAYRNTKLQQTFTAVDVMGGRNFMMGNYEFTPIDRPWDAISITGDNAWHAVLRAHTPEAKGATQGQLDKLALKYGLQYVWQHPEQSLARDVAKFFHFWQLERELVAGLSLGYWGGLPKPWVLALAAAIVGSYVSVLSAGILGWALRPPKQWRMHLFLLLIVAFVCGIHTLVFAHSRYHLPLMPLLGIYAAAAWTARRTLLTQWRRPAFWLAGTLCLVLALSWWRELPIDIARL